MLESKAQADEKAQHTCEYVSILKRSVMHPSVIELMRIPLRGATQLSDTRWGFETTSNLGGYLVHKTKKHAGNLSLLGGRLCLDFVNTLDWRGTDHPVEFLHTYHDLVVWSRHAGMISDLEAKRLSQKAKIDASQAAKVLQEAIELREAIYRIFSSLAEGLPVAEPDLMIFNRHLGATMRSSKIIQQKQDLVWNTNGEPEKLDWILNPVVRSAADLLVSVERKRVKKCNDPDCGWLFLDISRNLSRRWCDMRDCGNRAKARRFYKKRKEYRNGNC
jgi:predicted RNA-binding Zn ribbon-like protein